MATKRKKKIERTTISPTLRAKIIGAIRRGNETQDIAESFGISDGTVFRIRRQALAAAGVNIKGIRVTPEYAAQALGRRTGQTPRPRKERAHAANVRAAVSAVAGTVIEGGEQTTLNVIETLRDENAALRALLKNLL